MCVQKVRRWPPQTRESERQKFCYNFFLLNFFVSSHETNMSEFGISKHVVVLMLFIYIACCMNILDEASGFLVLLGLYV